MTTIMSPWASTRIATDGQLAAPGWTNAGKLALGADGTLWVKNDGQWLYLALDITSEPTGNGHEDYFELSIDVDGNRQITPRVDVIYSTLPAPNDRALTRAYFLGPNGATHAVRASGDEEFIKALAASPGSASPHRIWQMKLALHELGVDFTSTALQTVGFGLRVGEVDQATKFPVTDHEYPANNQVDFSHLHQIVLSAGPVEQALPVDPAGPVLAGVGNVAHTYIANGYANTPQSYSLFPNLVDSAFGGTMQIKGNRQVLDQLRINHAARYQVLLDGDPLLESWDDYYFDGATLVRRTFTPDSNNQYTLDNPAVGYIGFPDLLVMWRSSGTAPGLHSLTVKFYRDDGTTEVALSPAAAQPLELMIDNNSPLAVMDRKKTRYNGHAIGPCAIEKLPGAVAFNISAYSNLGHLGGWSLTAGWDEGKRAAIASDSYGKHPETRPLWHGVTDLGPVPDVGWTVPEQCAYQFALTVWLRVTNGIPGQGGATAQDSRSVAFID